MTLDFIHQITVAVIFFAAGTLLGWFAHEIADRDRYRAGNEIVLIAVTIVWSASVLIDIISPEYETSPLIHGLMGAIVGFFYRVHKPGQNM